MNSFLTIDFPALLVALLASLLCALLGNFLILRKQAMMSDALSHVVLLGLVGGYLAFRSLAPLPMIIGALSACLIAVGLIFALSRITALERGAVMGIVFTVMFALGLVLLETATHGVHLDAHHALYGGLELTYWAKPHSWETFPLTIKSLACVLILCTGFVALFYRKLIAGSFDPIFARSAGLQEKLTSIGLMACIAIAMVASFDAVGSILVIALFVCPPAAARLLSTSMHMQIKLSLVFAVLSALTGYALAIALPNMAEFSHSLSGGGMIALCSSLYFGATFIYVRFRA